MEDRTHREKTGLPRPRHPTYSWRPNLKVSVLLPNPGQRCEVVRKPPGWRAAWALTRTTHRCRSGAAERSATASFGRVIRCAVCESVNVLREASGLAIKSALSGAATWPGTGSRAEAPTESCLTAPVALPPVGSVLVNTISAPIVRPPIVGAMLVAMGLRAASPVLVGREHELARLVEALDAAIEGGAATALVGGEAGVGKTRLVQEFGMLAERRGCRVCTGRCLEFGEAVWPLAPLGEIMATLVEELDGDVLDLVLGGARDVLSD